MINEGGDEMVCYRAHYKGSVDIILVLSQSKSIITIYINEVGDNHYTLKNELYQKEEVQNGSL